MRRFVVIGHEAPTTADFPLDDLPGSAGRLDVLCRCVMAGLLRSHGIRSDTEVVTIHQDELAVRFSGETVRHLHPDERSTAARFRSAIADAREAVGATEVESAPGIFVSHGDLASILADTPDPVIQLDPAGDPLTSLDPIDQGTFVLSDHRPFGPADRQLLAETIDDRVSLGPVALHADQAISIAHNYLDTEGYRTY